MRVNVVVLVNEPFVPVTVIVYVPPATVAGVTNVSVLVPEPVIEVGLKLAVALVGRPLAVRLVEPVNPALAVSVIVDVPLAPPAVTVTLPEFDSENPFDTVSVAGMLWTRLPLVPVMLNE
ncbi:MAG TPA: hypothetical protein VFW44_07060 [Bryobacteraceae bacterium]|nr:hypothetical protein [Bryobacteraceae bacterium]